MARVAAPEEAWREGLARLQTLVSDYTGVVRRVHETLRTPDDARMILMGCRMADGEPTGGIDFDLTAAGAHYSRERALAAALGEAVERYSGTCLPTSGTVLATAAEIGPEAVAPERFALHSEEQYAAEGFLFVPFTGDTPVRWVKGWSLADGADAYLPLQLAYMLQPGMCVAGEAEIAHGSSSGMALGIDLEGATLGGLLELVERDAVMLTWANRQPHPRLDWCGDDALARHDERHFAPAGLGHQVIDLSIYTGVPTAMALILVGDEDLGETGVAWGIGAASASTIGEAWDKALRECFQMRAALRQDLLEDPGVASLPAEKVHDPIDHVYYYANPANHPRLRFLAASAEVRETAAVPALEGAGPAGQVEAIMDRLNERGASAYAVDITPPDVADAGLRAIHVLSPELQPIDFPHRRRFLGGRRLYHAAHELGLREQPFAPSELNPEPHPFP